MRQEPVGGAELERARSYIALGLPRRFEATGDVARHIVEQELFGLGDDYYSRYVERVGAVTADDVLAAAQRNLRPEAATIVIAGDRTAIPSSAKLTA
jgi:zinc protease